MRLLTTNSVILCGHAGTVVPVDIHNCMIYIDGNALLVRDDVETKLVARCPYVNNTKPCTLTMAAQKGYSDFVFVNDKPVYLETVEGATNGDPPENIYNVKKVNQNWVECNE